MGKRVSLLRLRLSLLRIAIISLLFGLNACTALTAVSGAAVDRAISVFEDEEESLPVPVEQALMAARQSLVTLQLPPSLVELMDDGYIVSFDSEKLEGRIQLVSQTPNLTTIGVVVRKQIWAREDSVERAIIDTMKKEAQKIGRDVRSEWSQYKRVFVKPDEKSSIVGWFLPGYSFQVSSFKKDGWLKITLPSEAYAYIQGEIVDSKVSASRGI